MACALASGAVGPRTYPPTWSNPSGAVLQSVAQDVWAAERPFVWNSIDVGGRMAVVRLSDGTLWVHSPVALDAPLKAALTQLGPVAHVVSPNYEHLKYAPQWADAYPQATLYGCPGLQAKKPGYDAEVGQGDAAPAAWLGEIEALFLDFEHNPFTGKPFFNEVLFLHKPTGTLLVTDAWWNYPLRYPTEAGEQAVPRGTWLWKQGMDKVYAPFYKALMIKDEGAYASALDKILRWPFDAILPCHGSYVPKGGKQLILDHLRR